MLNLSDLPLPRHLHHQASLMRHVKVSHKAMTLTVKYQCAVCDFEHFNKRSISAHFSQIHGAPPPPVDVDGSKEKVCPYCAQTFPSKLSCSQHIREQHMVESCALVFTRQMINIAVSMRPRGSTHCQFAYVIWSMPGADRLAHFSWISVPSGVNASANTSPSTSWSTPESGLCLSKSHDGGGVRAGAAAYEAVKWETRSSSGLRSRLVAGPLGDV